MAELLVALAILGVIAVFTIPKVLQSQQSNQSKAIAKEAAAAITAAYQAYRLNNAVSGSFNMNSLSPYLNYVRVQTSGAIDRQANNTTAMNCDVVSSAPCFVLHNGAVLGTNADNTFGQTNPTNYIYFYIDPDGKANTTGVNDGPGKSVVFLLYASGRLGTWGQRKAGDITYETGASTDYGAGTPSSDPSWFNWN